MSIEKMISLHPDVAGNVNAPLALAVRHALYCSAMCTSCADACAAEEMVAHMRQCIRTCLDCADICTATARVATRRTGSNDIVLREMLQLCITACDICAEECARHDDEHCRLCAEMCRETARDCRAAVETL
ncbi:four-helix bundle copper-binding protein [Sphingosinicella sp. BN140058]|uniref:four-helix bundle copper-binding protein n=1 Tax=Sphingosinicella sp. BN140058 TaxID=1892855 RepID=UPI0010121056|nr:four-helix bundle copper-binding protein [Sphingosinicella sp. BN140058]QAY78231.1 four-helix bundle copper-binding protein [Sphingosinicella sp. BN140058]